MTPTTEHAATSARHTTGYLASGADDAPLLIFVHGWQGTPRIEWEAQNDGAAMTLFIVDAW